MKQRTVHGVFTLLFDSISDTKTLIKITYHTMKGAGGMDECPSNIDIIFLLAILYIEIK